MGKQAKIATVLLVLALVGSTSARVITVEVEGVVNSVSNDGGFALDGSVVVGSTMTGYCTYDSETPDLNPNVVNGSYALISISMTIGNYTIAHDPMSPDLARFLVFTVDAVYSAGSGNPRFDGTIYVDGSPQTYDDITWGYTELAPMNLFTSSSEYITTDALPDLDSWPDFSIFDGPKFFSTRFYDNGDGYFGIFGEVTSLTVIPEPAKTYYVNAVDGNDNNDGLSKETAFATIQKAIDSAYDGDTVIVADGTYTGPGNRDIDFLGKAITVRSENGPNNCIIDCQNSGCAFDFESGEDANSIVEGFTITNGDWGGIYCSSSSPTITNCNISNNMAFVGGAIFCYKSSPTISNCTISGNSAQGGGGIYCRDSSPTITNCTFSGNSSDLGGGIFCVHDSSPTISNCTISGNSANYGGGIYCEFSSSPTITNCTITANSAKWDGGGIYCRDSSPTITNCIITDNSAGYSGGGIFCRGSRPTISNCTISGNSAQYRGGGVYCSGEGATITNCILWDNTASEIYGSPIVTYSDIKGGFPGQGNIDADPYFVFSTDYHLMPDSACIDAGTNDPCGGLPATDKDGVPRPLDGDGDANAVADMGAYEYSLHSPTIAVSSRSFYFVQDWPKPDPQTLLIRNCGGQPLQWEIVEDCNWLEVIPTNGVSTGQINEVTITVDPNGRAPGLYSCTFNVQDQNASNSPVTIQATMPVGTVLPVPSPNYPTIQAAIDAADNYDVVLVAEGNYTGPGNRDIDFLGNRDTDFRGKAITVRSESGPENCIIDCNGTQEDRHRGFYFHNNENRNAVVEGFTITNGNERNGGGIFCHHGSPTIKNCIITANREGCGIACSDSSPTITNCIISGNSARRGGGGIYCSGGSPTITNCTITGNKAEEGGAIFCYKSSPTISNCTISGNSARFGGGVSCEEGSPTITNCIFSGNSAEWDGGGIFCWMISSPIITNCTIAKNQGRGVYCSGEGATITNCILWDNTDSEIYGSPIVTYSDIKGGFPGQGNIDADPYFVEPGYWDANYTPDDVNDDFWLDGDYHLLPYSFCIDAGDPNYVAEPNETDLDGNPRIVDGDNDGNSVVDMGAYEYFVPPIAFPMKFTPQALNPGSQGRWVKAHFVLPDGFAIEDVDVNIPATIEPLGIESEYINIFINEDSLVELEIGFDRADFCSGGDYGPAEVTVVGRLTSGQYFYGTDTIRIITNNLKYLAVLSSHWLEAGCSVPDWCGGADIDQNSVVDFVDFVLFDGCCIEVVNE